MVIEPLVVTTPAPVNAAPGEVDDAALVGSSPAFREALRCLPAVVETSSPVLLLGESGTGKEHVARTIHALGPRRHGPIVAVNCAAVPAELFESELFGHAAGAFSGAAHAKPGLLEVAHEGTLLLDEIGELPRASGAKLLRALEEKEVRRLGETRPRKLDFRLLCATREDLAREVAEGRFRPDLFYRISVFTVTLPPLRERTSDVPELARHLVARTAARAGRPCPVISPAAMTLLTEHSWPGNVRELANVLERALALAPDGVIEPSHLGLGQDPRARKRGGTLREALAQLERDLVTQALSARGGNVTAAARDLGVARQQLQRLIRRHGLVAPRRF
jgi:transcriptional regulator with PAS, ATPase and Fis domain